MPRVRRQNRSVIETPAGEDRLPLRWTVIIAVSSAVGLGVGHAAGLVAGVTVGIALAGLLHRVTA